MNQTMNQTMNRHLDLLQPYPFEKLTRLKAGIQPPTELQHIALSIGEPKHPAPEMVKAALRDHLDQLSVYPSTRGIDSLREAIATWATGRFKLKPGTLTAERHVLPVSGTREALFSFAQAIIRSEQQPPLVVSPNPFYQIYEGAALLAGAEPHFLSCRAENNWLPDFDAVPADIWKRCQLLYLCSPGNPTGAVMGLPQLKRLIALADRYDFVIASDECYSEIYSNESAPPPGILQACAELERLDYARCVAFHSLSKRSNLPGLRSGFVAGDAHLLAGFLSYRTYHGAAMPVQNQIASTLAWQDESHVRDNRAAYRAKFEAVIPILREAMPVDPTDAGFYLWPKVPGDDQTFARDLFARKHVTVLPGSYLSRTVDGFNPGSGYVRMALVAPLEECVEAATRIRDFVLNG